MCFATNKNPIHKTQQTSPVSSLLGGGDDNKIGDSETPSHVTHQQPPTISTKHHNSKPENRLFTINPNPTIFYQNPTGPKPSYAQATMGAVPAATMEDYDCSNVANLRLVAMHEGKPSVVFKKSDKARYLSMMNHVLIGKFSHGRPTIAVIQEFFVNFKLKGAYNLSIFDIKNLFIDHTSGHIWTFWSNMFDVEVVGDHRQYLHLKLTHLPTAKLYFITVVYAVCNIPERRVLWEALYDLKKCFSPWIVMGDFNALISGDERIGGNVPDPISMFDFSQCIKDCQLLDAGFVGSKYTWTNGKLSQRLDRVLCDQPCLDTFPILNVRHLAKTASDHALLLIEVKLLYDTSKGSFRFQNMWLHHADLKNVVFEYWSNPIYGDPFYILTNKLKRLKHRVREWNRVVFGNIFTNVDSAEEPVLVCENISKALDWTPIERLFNLLRLIISSV
ncbi:hypothetical protein LIER_19125 [Lithospermum erythrorhizon]|uniref:Endonuclease/exonuclease/phosphatase domain-containing protein n=1 Tax=Lithospermum erythrorhizon TaxID=34254 RepID=A0AAV3QKX6_LITER